MLKEVETAAAKGMPISRTEDNVKLKFTIKNYFRVKSCQTLNVSLAEERPNIKKIRTLLPDLRVKSPNSRALDLRANSKNIVSTFDIKFKNLNILKVFHLQ